MYPYLKLPYYYHCVISIYICYSKSKKKIIELNSFTLATADIAWDQSDMVPHDFLISDVSAQRPRPGSPHSETAEAPSDVNLRQR